MKRHRADWACIITILVLIFIFFHELFTTPPNLIVTPDFGSSDALSSISSKFLLSQALQHNTVPLWTDTLGGGFPIHAHGTIGTFFLPNLLLYRLVPFVLAYNLSLILSVAVFGVGWYAWLRRIGVAKLLGLFAALTLAFSGPVITQLTHLTVIQSMSLLPWILLCTQFLATTPTLRWLLVLALVSSQQMLVGFPQSVLITHLFAGAYYIFLVKQKPQPLRAFGLLVGSLLCAAILSAVQLIPSYEYKRQLADSGGFTQMVATSFSYPFRHLISMILPYYFGNPKLGTYPPFSSFDGSIFWENTGFVGWIPLGIIVCGLVQRCMAAVRRKKLPEQTRQLQLFLWATLAVALLLMTGSNSPIYFIFSFWPLNLFRVPSRFIWIFSAALTIIATLELSQLYLLRIKRSYINLIIILLLTINTTQLVWTFGHYHGLDTAADWLSAPDIVGAIGSHWRVYSIGAQTAHNSVFLTGGWTDLAPYRFLKGTLSPDKSPIWNIQQSTDVAGRTLARPGYAAQLLDQSIETSVNGATISAIAAKALDAYAIDTIVSAVPLTQTGLQPIASYTNNHGTITGYRNPTAAPPAYLAQKTLSVKTVEEAYRALNSDQFIPGATVLVEPGFDQTLATPSGSAKLTSHQQDGHATIAVAGNRTPALLVYAQSYYPGWRARIDGTNTRIYPANIAHMAIVVPAGNHTVEFLYAPKSILIGATLSSVGYGLVIGLMVFQRFGASARTGQTTAPLWWYLPRNHGTRRPRRR